MKESIEDQEMIGEIAESLQGLQRRIVSCDIIECKTIRFGSIVDEVLLASLIFLKIMRAILITLGIEINHPGP